ncbi:hypothetical protein D3C87_1235200 [compost metagenome]
MRHSSNLACAPPCAGLFVSLRHDTTRPHPLRAEPDRVHPPRQHPLRALSLGLRPPHEGRFHPAHRGYRCRAVVPGGGRRDSGVHGLARHGYRRRSVLPDAAHGPLPRGGAADAGDRPRVPLLHEHRGTGRAARGPARRRREAALQRLLAPRARQGPARAAGRRAARGALQESDRRQRGLGRRREGSHRDLERRAGRPGDRPPGRHAHVQLLRRGG